LRKQTTTATKDIGKEIEACGGVDQRIPVGRTPWTNSKVEELGEKRELPN